MKGVNLHVAVVGCGRVGSRLAKELCRFFESLEERPIRKLALFDGAVVDADDISGQEYLPEDIGWHKSAVMAGICKEQFVHVPIAGYGHLTDEQVLKEGIGLQNVYDSDNRVAVIYDMSNGDRQAQKAIREFYNSYKNSIVISVAAKNRVHTAVKLAGMRMGRIVASAKMRALSTADAVRIARLCLTKMAILVSEGRLEDYDLCLVSDGFGVLEETQVKACQYKPRRVSFAKKEEPMLVVVVGCGGTGGNFVKDFVHGEMAEDKRLSLLLIDGDRVEQKNLSRQPFSKGDILQNKARCLKEDLLAENPALSGRLFDYPFYLDTADDLREAVALTGHEGKLVLVGAVDNHRARQVLEAYYHEFNDIIYVDAANEWSNGEVVVSAKKRGKELSPLRSFFYPDVLTDNGLSASEMSCGVVNESSPQHLCTNLASAQGILGALSPVIHGGKVRGGIFYFDAFKEYARFQEVWSAEFI